MNWFGSGGSAEMLSRQDGGEKNLQRLEGSLSEVIQGLSIGKPKEMEVKLWLHEKGEVDCVLKISCKRTLGAQEIKEFDIATVITEKKNKNTVASRIYNIKCFTDSVEITSGLDVFGGYEGNKLGSALLLATDQVVEKFLQIANSYVNGKTVTMFVADRAHPVNGEYIRKGWTSRMMGSTDFTPVDGEHKTFFKQYR